MEQQQQNILPQQGLDHSLYVGDLHRDVTERMLYEQFRQYGGVTGVNVCVDPYSKVSLGYAYVNFQEKENAAKAMSELNYTDIFGKPCRIMWVTKDPNERKSGKGNIFIRNLHPDITNRDLYETFKQLGELLSCKVATNHDGSSRGYGYVHFQNDEDAQKAIDKVSGQELMNQVVTVSKFIPKRERDAHKMKSWTNIYTKDLPDSIKTDEDLQKLFEEYGKITSPKLAVDENGVSKGFGFVNFESHDSAEKALEANGTEVEGKTLYVSRAKTKTERAQELAKQRVELKKQRQKEYFGKNLYVKNLDDNINKEDLQSAFEEFGEITSVAVMQDDKGYSKGFGFVCFKEKDSAKTALEAMRNQTLAGSSKKLFVAFHEPREQRLVRMQKVKRERRQQEMSSQFLPYGAPYGGRYPVYAVPQRMNQRPNVPAQAQAPAPADIASPEDRMAQLSEKLYAKLNSITPNYASKITGMFINANWPLEQKEALLTDDNMLRSAIEAAISAIENSPESAQSS